MCRPSVIATSVQVKVIYTTKIMTKAINSETYLVNIMLATHTWHDKSPAQQVMSTQRHGLNVGTKYDIWRNTVTSQTGNDQSTGCDKTHTSGALWDVHLVCVFHCNIQKHFCRLHTVAQSPTKQYQSHWSSSSHSSHLHYTVVHFRTNSRTIIHNALGPHTDKHVSHCPQALIFFLSVCASPGLWT